MKRTLPLKGINLLPPRIIQARAGRERLPLFIVLFLLGATTVLISWISVSQEDRQQQLQVTQASYTLSDAQQRQAKQLAKLSDPDLRARVSAINLFSKNEINWVQAFTKLNQLTPKDSQISQVSFASGTTGVTVHLTGTSPTSISFADFVASLHVDPSISQITVDGFTYNVQSRAVTFSVSIILPFSVLTYQAPKHA